MNVITNWIKRNASTILTCIGAAGMVGTVIMAVKAAPKAIEKMDEETKDIPYGELTKMDVIKAELPVYLPTIAVGTASLMCIFGANALNQKQQAMMVSAYAALERSYLDYRNRVQLLCGDTEAEFIDRTLEQQKQEAEDDMPPWEGPQTFYIKLYDKFFERTMEEIIQAEYHLNRIFILRGYATFNEFLDFLHLEHVEEGDVIGWEQYAGETHFGYEWVDFGNVRRVTDDMIICEIQMPFEPHYLDVDWAVGTY